jgi:hypothetical protein
MKRLLPAITAFAALLTGTAALAAPNTTTTARLIRVTSPVAPPARATLVAHAVPARLCTITVLYKNSRAHARGLYPKRPVRGRVSWTWKVGLRTPNGTWPIKVNCGSAGSFLTHFTVFSTLG